MTSLEGPPTLIQARRERVVEVRGGLGLFGGVLGCFGVVVVGFAFTFCVVFFLVCGVGRWFLVVGVGGCFVGCFYESPPKTRLRRKARKKTNLLQLNVFPTTTLDQNQLPRSRCGPDPGGLFGGTGVVFLGFWGVVFFCSSLGFPS